MATWTRQGHKVALGILAAEKTSQNFTFEVTNPGGHSSRPVADNAIYHLVRAVDRVSHYEFPVQLDDANRGYFTGMSKIMGGENGAAMAAVVKNPNDRCGGCRSGQRPELARDAAHYVCGDDAFRWPCDQRSTATGASEYQLPDFSRRVARRNSGATGKDRGRSRSCGERFLKCGGRSRIPPRSRRKF